MAWTPAGVAGLRLCLDAKSLLGAHGDPVTLWPDNSGVAGTASVVGAATIDRTNDVARPAVRLIDTARVLMPGGALSSLVGATGGEIFAVLKADTAAGRHGLWYLYDSDFASHYVYDSTVYDAAFSTTRNISFVPSTSIATAPRLLNVFGKTGSKGIRYDGALVASSAAAVFTAKASGGWFGASKTYTNAIEQLSARWYCFLVYDHVLTPADRDQVNREIADHYLLTVKLSDGSTYVGSSVVVTLAHGRSQSAFTAKGAAELKLAPTVVQTQGRASAVLGARGAASLVRVPGAKISASGSLTSRWDTVARNYRIAFSMGPWGVADLSHGVYARAWRVEALYHSATASGEVILQRATEDGTDWEAAVSVFAYTGPPIKEVDLAFDQSGNTYISADRDTGVAGTSEVWMYWYNSLAGSFLFETFSVGKTPRLLLDDPDVVTNSDLMLFYLNDTNQRVEYRMQREFFDTAYQVPVDQWYDLATHGGVLQSSTINLFLEEVARSKDYRLHLIVSQWEPISGTYKLLVAETAPYTVPFSEATSPSASLDGASTIFDTFLVDNVEPILPIVGLTTIDKLLLTVLFSQFSDDSIAPAASLDAINLAVVTLIFDQYPGDNIKPATAIAVITSTVDTIIASGLTDSAIPRTALVSINKVSV